MNSKFNRFLIGILGANGALLIATAILTSGFFFPTRLPVFSRALLALGAVGSPVAVFVLWEKARDNRKGQ